MDIENKIIELQGQREIFGFFNLVSQLDRQIDAYFDITSKEEFIESKEEGLYAGIEMEALSTSYIDYYQVLMDINEGETLIDVGAGYCRGSFLGSVINRKCVSIEIDKNRSMLAKERFSDSVLQIDIMKRALPNGNIYFLYLPWGYLTNKILKTIYERNSKCILYIIESHGDFIENLSIYEEFHLLECNLNVSSKRYKDKIYKYEFKPSDKFKKTTRESFKIKGMVPYWLIKYFEEVKTIEISSTNLKGNTRKWNASFLNSYACYYNKKISLFLPSCSRYLQYQFDTIIAYSS